MTISIVLDVATVAMVLYFIYKATKRGFLESVLDIIGHFASVIAAFFAGKALAPWLYDIAFKSSIENAVGKKLSEIVSSASLTEKINNILCILPKFSASILGYFGVTPESAAEVIGNQGTAIAAKSSDAICDSIIKPIFVSVLTAVLFLLLFFICLSIIRRVIPFLCRNLLSGPMQPAHFISGCILGTVKAAMILFFITTIVSLYISISGSGISTSAYEAIASTKILKSIFNLNPLCSSLF